MKSSDSLPRSPSGSWVRRYGLIAYWLIFAVVTLDWARSPGFVPNPESVPYPWTGVFVTWGIIGIETAILYAILRPQTFDESWRRLGGAFLFATALLVLSMFTFVTDFPGYIYVLHFFSLITFVGLALFAAVLGVRRRIRRHRNSTARAA